MDTISKDEAEAELSSLRSGGGGRSKYEKYREPLQDLSDDDAIKAKLKGGYSQVSGLRSWVKNNFGKDAFTVKSAKAEGEEDKEQDEATYVVVVYKGDA